jgi:hypothetical protein
MSSNSFDSSGKPAPVTLIRAPQQGTWPNQTYITVAQKPNTGKPIQQTSNQLSVLIGRVKQDPSIDDPQQQQQQQRSDMNDPKQLIYQSFTINNNNFYSTTKSIATMAYFRNPTTIKSTS